MLHREDTLEKLPSDMSYSAVGCEFNANESKYILNKAPLNRNIHEIRLYIDLLMKMLWPEAYRNLSLYLP